MFDTLTTKRPYKDPWPMETAVTHIESLSGIMFDPAMMDDLKNCLSAGR